MKGLMRNRKISLTLLLLAVLLAITAFVQAESGGPYGLQVVRQTALLMSEDVEIGTAEFWNTRNNFMVEFLLPDGWFLTETQIYAGADPVPVYMDKPVPGRFPCRRQFEESRESSMVQCSFADELNNSWGGNRTRYVAIHAEISEADDKGKVIAEHDAWAYFEPTAGQWERSRWGWWFTTVFTHPRRGHFIDSPVSGLTYQTPTNWGTTDASGAFDYFPGEEVDLWLGSVHLGKALAANKISPLDIFMLDIEIGEDGDNGPVVNMARLLQSLDADGNPKGGIDIPPVVVGCLDMAVSELGIDGVNFEDDALIQALIEETFYQCQANPEGIVLIEVSAAEAAANLEEGISQSGIFRKNVSKEEDFAADKIKLEVMPIYLPGLKSDGTPSFCDANQNDVYDLGEEGVPYEEWRLGGDPGAAECDPRVDPDACLITLIECRDVAKPVIAAYLQQVDIFDEKVTTEFYPDRFSNDVFVSISRDDGATWKRMNVSRMADLSSYDLLSGEPFPGTTRSPQMKIVDNKILVVWTSTFTRGGNPRYAITTCDDPMTPEVETPDTGCQVICRGDADNGTEVCEPDYPYDDAYYVEDIWGVSGHQGSVDYDEVDDVADLGIGEIPYSALWAARGVIVTQKELDEDIFLSLGEDDPNTTEDEGVGLGDIVWYKPERLTSGRRDAYIPVLAGTRGAGFAVAWQEDPEGLRPGKGKGPGQGWSGAISNHKTDIWYSYVDIDEFATVDENFIPGGTPDEDRPGLGRPKALVPLALPVRVSDNDMVNTDTLKVELDAGGLPVVQDGSFLPVDPLTVEHGNATGTKRFAYLAGTDPLYQYYWENLDLCDLSGTNAIMTELPGTNHERWYQFTNNADALKTVCVSSDGRILDGDVSASRSMISIQPYQKTLPDGTKEASAYVLLAYEESKGMGETLDISHDEILAPDDGGDSGQEKPPKQDLGKNVLYHSFDFKEPDLVAPGHMVNLPAICGGILPTVDFYGDDDDDPNTVDPPDCEPGQPIPLYFDDIDGNPIQDEAHFMQYRTEIARRTRFIVQSMGRMKADGGTTGTIGAIIYKQGQEGQGRPADVFIRRIVVPDANPDVPGLQVSGNPYAFENFECTAYLDTYGVEAFNRNAWGEPTGDKLCGGVFTDPIGGYPRRDHVNLTSADIDMAVDAGPDDGTPDDTSDDIYGTNKVLLWSQHDYNLGDESFGLLDGSTCDPLLGEVCPGMYSNARSHRGFIRGDFLVTAFAYSPNWAAGRNGNDRYNFYIRKSFDGGQTWTTTPAALDGEGVYMCPEWRTDPNTPDADGSGNAPPLGIDPDCSICTSVDADGSCLATDSALFYAAGAFQPSIKVSEFDNNKETSSDPRLGATPPVRPYDGRDASLPILTFVEDTYNNNVLFVAWGAGDNMKSTGGTTVTPEAPPTDVYYTRSENYGDTFLRLPWEVNGANSNFAGETVWRYDFLAHGDPEQGECQIRATSDGSKMYAIWHQATPGHEDPDEPITRWYPWEPEETYENDVWFRRIIFWPDGLLPGDPVEVPVE